MNTIDIYDNVLHLATVKTENAAPVRHIAF